MLARMVLASLVLVCEACGAAQEPGAGPPTESTAAAPRSEAEAAAARPVVRLHLAGGGGLGSVEPAMREAVARELGAAGFAVVGWQDVGGVDLLLTVTGALPDASPPHRVAFTLSATIEGHEMEDVSGHFTLRGDSVDDVTVREVCQRWRRRYRRFREASRPAEL